MGLIFRGGAEVAAKALEKLDEEAEETDCKLYGAAMTMAEWAVGILG